jgi:hypothetical protein
VNQFPLFSAISLACFLCAPADPPKPKAKTLPTVVSKVGNVTSVVEDVPPVPPKCRVTVAISPKVSDEAMTLWDVSPEDGVEFESEQPNKLTVLVPVGVERDYRFRWVGREPKGKQRTERITVKAGKGPRPPPDPDPPTPDPDVAPPIPEAGNRVLIVYETADQANYTKGQIDFMYSADVRQYLTEKCPKSGTSNGWYMLDKDAVMNVMPELWKKAFARPRTKLPWLIVSNGKTGWEGPIPDRYEDAFSKVKDFIK